MREYKSKIFTSPLDQNGHPNPEFFNVPALLTTITTLSATVTAKEEELKLMMERRADALKTAEERRDKILELEKHIFIKQKVIEILESKIGEQK